LSFIFVTAALSRGQIARYLYGMEVSMPSAFSKLRVCL